MNTTPRFFAEWINKQHVDEHGEWEPDRDEYMKQLCRNLDEAKLVAVAMGKKANVVEWARVAEENFNAEVGISPRHPAAWDTVRVWHGDWQGNWDEERW